MFEYQDWMTRSSWKVLALDLVALKSTLHKRMLNFQYLLKDRFFFGDQITSNVQVWGCFTFNDVF